MSDYSAPPLGTSTPPSGTSTPPSATSTHSPYAESQYSDTSSDQSMKDKAASTLEAGKHAGSDVAQTAAEGVKNVAGETKKQARNLAGEARDQLRQQAGEQHRSLVQNLRSLSDELGGMAQGNQQSGLATDLVGQARDRVDGIADWLDRREPGDLLDEVRSFARQRPGTFLLGAALAGVAAGRLTRGIVAEHSDNGGDAYTASYPATPAMAQPPAVPLSAPPVDLPTAAEQETTVIGYGTPPAGAPGSGYGTQGGYGTEGGYGTQGGAGSYGQGGSTEAGYGTYGEPR
jgi:hypothetical protein